MEMELEPKALARQSAPEETALTASLLREAAQALLGAIDQRTREVLEFRFGLQGNPPVTLQAVGNRMRLTRERIRQIETAGMRVLRSSDRDDFGTVRTARAGLRSLLASLGGAALEQALLESVGGRGARDTAALRLILASMTGIGEARETKRTYRHWTMTAPAADIEKPLGLESVLEAAERILERSGKLLSERELLTSIRRDLNIASSVADAHLRSLLAIGKRIVRTPFGDWGLRGWPEATPRSAGDKAYIVLKRAEKPLHFTAIAGEINKLQFGGKPTHPQTVHNELIRSSRFVLVGRGIYGLRERGYESGTVAEVVTRILTRAGRPLPKQEIVSAVLRERQVKRNTVLLALQNRKLFRPQGDGTYALAAAAIADSPASPQTSPGDHDAQRSAPPTTRSAP